MPTNPALRLRYHSRYLYNIKIVREGKEGGRGEGGVKEGKERVREKEEEKKRGKENRKKKEEIERDKKREKGEKWLGGARRILVHFMLTFWLTEARLNKTTA